MVTVDVRFAHPFDKQPVIVPVTFQIDTGADSTSLFNWEMENLAEFDITYDDIELLDESDWACGILGEPLPTYRIPNAELVFEGRTGEERVEALENLFVLRLPDLESNDVFACRALLGMDVLKRFRLVVDCERHSASAKTH